jgi:hypothetical protein
VSEDHIYLLPIVGASSGACWAGLAESCGFLHDPVQPTALTVQSAARAGKCQRERHISDEIRNLKDEITKPDTDRLITQDAIVHGERGRDRMAKILPPHGTIRPSLEIFLDLLADHALCNRSELGIPVA